MSKVEACRNCGSIIPEAAFTGRILEKTVAYFDCRDCGYVQTESPTWLEEAYSSPINVTDTGIVQRNLINARVVLATIAALGNNQARVADCAGGYGLLVRHLRDMGVDAFWSDKYCTNLLARGFEHEGSQVDLVTSFEAFEHFEYPERELAALFDMAPSVLLSTTLISDPAPVPGTWWYYGAEHGQHIGFFRLRTLEGLARRFGKHLYTDGTSYHLLSAKAINPAVWRIYRKIAQRAPGVFAARLKSKTWPDYVKLGGACK